ncbi:beta-ketoacyl synthase chain length factor [Pinirhizobacter soli]|uniref:beta-ketoacyl synthase chain length factor n=1 Tax=Pinirhizobacter soli TaxID=2786953 RepID=UPI002029CB20|nr:beta-ketoacyl synthase chain length factor [Pinirhizobacter soli]
MRGLEVFVQGAGLWAPAVATWADFKPWLDGALDDAEPGKPRAEVLPANERRRAPDSVLLAATAAGQAVAASGLDPAALASVFSSAHGDQAITDYMCATLAESPAGLSPTRFHNSVHNAPAGYWTIATVCHAACSAVSAGDASFGAGLLEAAAQAIADDHPVLLAAFDTRGYGPLLSMTKITLPFSTALVLSPSRTPQSTARLVITTTPMAPVSRTRDDRLQAWATMNPSAAGLPLLEALAHGTGVDVVLAAAAGMALHITGETLT